MFESIRRFFETLIGNNKQSVKFDDTEIIKTVSNTNNNKNNMNRNEIVLPGHYCSKDTINSEVKNIIRVLGPDKTRNNYWLIDNGKPMSTNTILDNYVALDTKPSTDKTKRDSIMSNFKPVKPNFDTTVNSVVWDEKYNEDSEEKQNQPLLAPYIESIPEHLLPPENRNVKSEKVKPVDPYADIRQLLNRASIKTLNENSQRKYGIDKYKEQTFDVTVSIPIPYELSKLSQICELFDIDTKEVAELIVSELQLPKATLMSIIIHYLDGDIKQQTKIEPEVITVLLDNKQTNNNEQQEKLDAGISQIDSYIENLFK